MAAPATEVVKINWKQICPWLALFKTLGMTLHVRQVCVGIVAAALISLMQNLLWRRPWTSGPSMGVPWDQLVVGIWSPIYDVIWPIVVPDFPLHGPGLLPTWWELIKFLFTLAWNFTVAGLAGGLIVRRAGFEFCREESLSVKDSGRFVAQRALDYLSAPALPLAVLTALGAFLMVIGWFARSVPGGGYVGSILWIPTLLAGWGMALLMLLTIAAWPLMITAVSINGGDGFDALSRGFGLVIDRWRYYAWCVLVMTGYGALCALLLRVLTLTAEHLIMEQLVLTKMGGATVFAAFPQLMPNATWPLCFSLIGRGLAYSFFWSSMTIIYLVLRKSTDNAELQDIYVDGGPQEPDDLKALLNPQNAPNPDLLPIVDPPR